MKGTNLRPKGGPPAPAAGRDDAEPLPRGDHWDHCPNCGHHLVASRCKYHCPRCHYFMSCSDFDQ